MLAATKKNLLFCLWSTLIFAAVSGVGLGVRYVFCNGKMHNSEICYDPVPAACILFIVMTGVLFIPMVLCSYLFYLLGELMTSLFLATPVRVKDRKAAREINDKMTVAIHSPIFDPEYNQWIVKTVYDETRELAEVIYVSCGVVAYLIVCYVIFCASGPAVSFWLVVASLDAFVLPAFLHALASFVIDSMKTKQL